MVAIEIFNKVVCLVNARNWPNNDWDSELEELEVMIRSLNFRETNLLLNKLIEQKLVEQKELMNFGLPNPIDSCIGLIIKGLSKKFLEAVKDIESHKGLTNEAHEVARLIEKLSEFWVRAISAGRN